MDDQTILKAALDAAWNRHHRQNIPVGEMRPDMAFNEGFLCGARWFQAELKKGFDAIKSKHTPEETAREFVPAPSEMKAAAQKALTGAGSQGTVLQGLRDHDVYDSPQETESCQMGCACPLHEEGMRKAHEELKNVPAETAPQYNWVSTGPGGCDNHCIEHPCGRCITGQYGPVKTERDK